LLFGYYHYHYTTMAAGEDPVEESPVAQDVKLIPGSWVKIAYEMKG